MMYRQILVREEDRKYQHIFWRHSNNDPVREYQLNAVTYGLACFPYLAQRVLKQLQTDEGEPFPEARKAILCQTYMDDIVARANSVQEAFQLYSQLKQLLGKGGFFPRKWASSSTAVLDMIPHEHHDLESSVIHKILGLRWHPASDSFTYHTTPFAGKFTKRSVLSYIVRMFDPLGWLTPVIFACKSFMQQLWILGLGWDDFIPPKKIEQWNQLTTAIQELTNVKLSRYIPDNDSRQSQIVGFCDATEQGFDCLIYIRSLLQEQVSVKLVAAKSKVSPIKPLTIPKLELNAAVLLLKLYSSLKPVFNRFGITDCYFFSDSQIVLSWVRTPPIKLKSYVANRVSLILENTSVENWHFVKSEDNPADPDSRGNYLAVTQPMSLWWQGPSFLYQDHLNLSTITPIEADQLPETKTIPNCFTTTTISSHEPLELAKRVSSLFKLQSIFGFVLRFINATRNKTRYSQIELSVQETEEVLFRYVRLCQHQHWSSEIKQLTRGLMVEQWKTLTPFLDENGLVRVGGRLKNSPLPYRAKHPVLIPQNSDVAQLIIRQAHILTLHGGPQLTRSYIQQRFWIINVGKLIKSCIFHCIKCKRFDTKPVNPLMADIPAIRFDQVRPFLSTGVDFAGPFTMKETQRRDTRLFKAYICVYVCFSTKAVHLEVMQSLATDSFLAATDRFIARRGLCAFLHSDKGTNFVGAANKLSEIYNWLSMQETSLRKSLNLRKIEWVFNPLAAPHFGGLWEAVVKSFKRHLHSISGNHVFTLEEFSTLSCKIEAILNSRPLFPLSTNPSDMSELLTPSHFLIGGSLFAAPELPLTDKPLNHFHRWQLITQNTQQFWKLWKTSYLHTLMQRKKWNKKVEPLQVGDIVCIRRENTSPLNWPLGRILEIKPSKDGVIRVVTIKCQNSVLTRPAHVICKLL